VSHAFRTHPTLPTTDSHVLPACFVPQSPSMQLVDTMQRQLVDHDSQSYQDPLIRAWTRQELTAFLSIFVLLDKNLSRDMYDLEIPPIQQVHLQWCFRAFNAIGLDMTG